jgi:hypothetical protein
VSQEQRLSESPQAVMLQKKQNKTKQKNLPSKPWKHDSL